MEVTVADLGDIVYVDGVAHLVLTEEVRDRIAQTLAQDPYETGEYHGE